MNGEVEAQVGLWCACDHPASPVAVGNRCFQFQFMLSGAALLQAGITYHAWEKKCHVFI